ncbi:MAG: hypothetical protein JNK37_23130 [Verrucomicrobiales bacterium]|nr:hypothetical protein [Verrucomicrobiales bacterium]
MEFLTEHSEFSREAREEREDNIGSLFLWSVVIVVLLGLNAFSWLFCMYVFGNPEVPFNYQLLTKLERLEPITGFKPVDAPRGKFHNVKDLYLEYYDFSDEKLNAYNGILKRFYLKNYLERNDVRFVRGTFKVESARELTPDDVFPHGVAVRLQAEDYPAAHVDFVLPSPADAEIPAEHFRPGDVIQIQESATCAALVHIHRMEEDHVCFTVVPLVMRDYETPAGTALKVAPPEWLNLGSGRWPVSDGPELVAKPLDVPTSEEPADPPAGETAPPPAEKGADPKKSAEPAKK